MCIWPGKIYYQRNNTQKKGRAKEKDNGKDKNKGKKKKMAAVEEPILSRLDRLDNIIKKLEEVRGGDHSPKTSTASSETLTSDGQASSLDFSPRSMEKHCRPIDDVISETEHKGTLIERLVNVENRVLNVCLQLEAELEMMKKQKEEDLVLEETLKKKREESVGVIEENKKSPHKKGGFKSFVKYCVQGKGIGKHRHKD